MLLTHLQIERLEKTLVELSCLDESLVRRCGSLIKAERFDEAVRAAFIVLEERLRKVLKVPGGTGVDLSQKAFAPGKGDLIPNLNLRTLSEEEGVRDLFVGAFKAYRNRAAHTFAGYTLEESCAVIELVNLLLLILRQTEVKWYDKLAREVAATVSPEAARRFRDFLLRLEQLGIRHYEGKTWEPFKASVLYQAKDWDEPRHWETAVFYFVRTGKDAPTIDFPMGGDLRKVVDFDREHMEQRLLEVGCERVARRMNTIRLVLTERNDQATFDRLYDVIREYVERYG
jgi:uncharacterized protein (TIGR02391 family)